MRTSVRSEEHVGEWKVTLRADTPEEIFAGAARVVSRECGPVKGESGPWEPVALSARDLPTLLVDWINELLGRSEVEGRAYGEVRHIHLSEGRMEAEVRGAPVTSWRSSLKAATYHDVSFAREGTRWKAVVLLDV